jgi:hypothetical protein
MPTAAAATAARHACCSASIEMLTAAAVLAVLHWIAALPVLLCADSGVLLIFRSAACHCTFLKILSQYIVSAAVAAHWQQFYRAECTSVCALIISVVSHCYKWLSSVAMMSALHATATSMSTYSPAAATAHLPLQQRRSARLRRREAAELINANSAKLPWPTVTVSSTNSSGSRKSYRFASAEHEVSAVCKLQSV